MKRVLHRRRKGEKPCEIVIFTRISVVGVKMPARDGCRIRQEIGKSGARVSRREDHKENKGGGADSFDEVAAARDSPWR